MKQLLQSQFGLFLLILLTFGCEPQQTEKSVISSNIKTIKYYINDEIHPSWTIVPEAKPDRLTVECRTTETLVAFVTDMDSIAFQIKEGDTVQFYVLLNQTDSALTEIVGIPPNVHFSDEYIQANRGKFAVEIPEVHELANIMVAVSKVGQLDSNMVDMTTDYHKEVIAHFGSFGNHPAIDTINNHITAPFDENSYWYYYALKMNACGYVFEENHNIADDGIIHKMGFDYPDDPFKYHKALFEDFAAKSNFREFYKEHQDYYDTLISTYRQYNPIDKMQQWLEEKFPYKYGNYRVTFSPLVGGAHSTQRFADNGFEQTVMFVCRATPSSRYNAAVNEMLDSRVVFTEIDHNFVNPVSNKYSKEIESALSDRSKWVDEVPGSSAYSSPYAVFNEYMTWAIYSPYCIDNFSEADVAQFLPRMENQMVNGRGFKQFDKFNQELVSLYKANPEIDIDELYKKMLDWCNKHN